jgi:hypothetical protein
MNILSVMGHNEELVLVFMYTETQFVGNRPWRPIEFSDVQDPTLSR